MYDDGESSAGDNETLGYASYHFEEEKSYISYSSGEQNCKKNNFFLNFG